MSRATTKLDENDARRIREALAESKTAALRALSASDHAPRQLIRRIETICELIEFTQARLAALKVRTW